MTKNPFEFEAAIRFSATEMVDYFVDDNNFARFIQSQRNVFLLGERGTGKTMMLRYYSLPIQVHKNEGDISKIGNSLGIYIPCRNVTLAKSEPELLPKWSRELMSEHLLVVSVVNSIASALIEIENEVLPEEEKSLRKQLEFIFQWELPEDSTIFKSLKSSALRESINIQKVLNSRKPDCFYDNAVTYSSVVVPLIETLLSEISFFRGKHFNLLFDDAEALSSTQNAVLNSWIASRTTSQISFKVATSFVDQQDLTTRTGGELLERHDFIRVDMTQDFQNREASYHRLAKDIVNRRLEKANVSERADDFFPINPEMEKDLKEAEQSAKIKAKQKFPDGTDKQISDYVYKLKRAEYFRSRSPHANLPPYSGFELLVNISTGVIRYLLEPCFEMFDAELSKKKSENIVIKKIEPSTQATILKEMSTRRWEWVRDGFNNSVRGCTNEDALHIFQILDNIALLFKHRLLNHASEPRAITFTISGRDKVEDIDKLDGLIEIARRAQILFMRTSSGKTRDKRISYYTFDRLFWIERGLDPIGQNATVSIEAKYLIEAALHNNKLPVSAENKKHNSQVAEQPDFFT